MSSRASDFSPALLRASGKENSHFPWILATLFAVEFVALAVDPTDRKTWLLENLMSVPLALIVVLFRGSLRLSYTSNVLIFLFLGIHVVGSHYTYSLVPLPASLLGEGDRNHYDRWVHFCFGLLLFLPIVELLWNVLGRRSKRLGIVLGLSLILSFSTIYELLEWTAAVIVDPEQGVAFVGAQGDVWDAQKDTALALLGALLAAAWVGRPRLRAPNL